MTLERERAIGIGVLFLLATTSYIAGSTIISGVLASAGVASQSTGRLALGILLEFGDVAAVVAIGVLFVPVIGRTHPGIAYGYLATRIVEGSLLAVGGVAAAILLPGPGEILAGGGVPTSLASLAAALRVGAFQLGMLSLGVGSLFFVYSLFVTRVVPRLLTLLGGIGYLGLIVSAVLGLLGVGGADLLYIPGAIFEIGLPIWLLIKGFRTEAQA